MTGLQFCSLGRLYAVVLPRVIDLRKCWFSVQDFVLGKQPEELGFDPSIEKLSSEEKRGQALPPVITC